MLRVNSKKVKPGDTFLALQGPYTDGHDYIGEAIDKGAACIIATHGEYPVKTIITEDTRTYLSNYLKELNLEKLEKIKLIAVTGTYGKTVTSDLLYQLLNSLNIKTAYIGTNGFYLDGKIKKTSSTTPDIYEIYELIGEAVDSECEIVIIETSSNAIAQRHIEGLRFDAAIFTNFTPNKYVDKNKYLNDKIEPFKMLKKNGYAIINKSDPYYEYFVLPQNTNIFYGPNDTNYPINIINANYEYTEFTVASNLIKIPLIGKFNVYNYVPAYIIAKILNIDDETILSSTLSLHPADGRFDTIKYKNNLIIIDYAHDLDGIKNIIKKTKEISKGKIITIIGSGGERRQDQRPAIGKLVTDSSDYAIFTTDNPRHENEEEIIDSMIANITKENFQTITSRKEAIKKGISMLENEDILLILGKGHEDSQIIGSDEFPFKDRDEVLKNIK